MAPSNWSSASKGAEAQKAEDPGLGGPLSTLGLGLSAASFCSSSAG